MEKECVLIEVARRQGPAGRDDAPPEYAYEVKGGCTISHEEARTKILDGQPKTWAGYKATVAHMKRKGPRAPRLAMCLIIYENVTDAVDFVMSIAADNPYWGPEFWLDGLSMALLAEAPTLESEEFRKASALSKFAAIRATESFVNGTLKFNGKDPRLSSFIHVWERAHGVAPVHMDHHTCQNCGKSQESQMARLLM